jgi:hypothetical protein
MSTQLAEEITQEVRPNKYKYAEFGDLAGERRLKAILRKILPLALFETWQVLACENQANGNDAFMSISKLAEARQRTERKIRLDLAELRARRLLTMRCERKAFLGADGRVRTRLVMVKDFEGLYDLAYEYLLWEESDCHIEPDREYAEAMRENEELVKKLRRFDNYRRILCNSQPGPVAQEKEIHRWYKDYDEQPRCETKQDDEEGAEQVTEEITSAIRKKYLSKELQKELQEVSKERQRASNNNNQQNRDSFDSEACSEERVGASADYMKPTEPQGTASQRNEAKGVSSPTQAPTTQTNPTRLPPFGSKKGAAAKQTARQESTEREPAVKAAKQAMQVAAGGRGKGKVSPGRPLPPPNALASTFLSQMCTDFLHDKNPKGSETYILRLIEEHGLTDGGMDTLMCLVQAYVYARDTKTVHEKHRHPDGDNKMPLFCRMFGIYAKKWSSGSWDYSEEDLEAELGKDSRLELFVLGYGERSQQVESSAPQGAEDDQGHGEQHITVLGEGQALVSIQVSEGSCLTAHFCKDLSGTPSGEGEGQALVSEAASPGEGSACENQAVVSEDRALVSEPEQEVVEIEPLDTDDPLDGWSYDNAEHFGTRLCELLGRSTYHHIILPTRCPGRYGFIVQDREKGAILGEFVTSLQIQQCKERYRAGAQLGKR